MIMNIDNESSSSRNIRATVPSSIEDGVYVVQLKYNGLIVDTVRIEISFFGDLHAQRISSWLAPSDSPSWLVDLNSYGEGNPGEWQFTLGETWMRAIDGSLVQLDSTKLSSSSSDIGPGIVETDLQMQPRPGSKVWQSAVISSTPSSEVRLAGDVEYVQQWSVSTIDLTLGNPIGTSSMISDWIDSEIGYVREFVTSSENPSNDIFYTISADCEGVAVSGISGVANLYSAMGSSIRQTQTFETNEWGQAGIMFDYAALPSGNYTVILEVDDEWKEWISSIPEVSVFSIDSNWNGLEEGEANIVETDFDLTANIRRSTLIAGEDRSGLDC